MTKEETIVFMQEEFGVSFVEDVEERY